MAERKTYMESLRRRALVTGPGGLVYRGAPAGGGGGEPLTLPFLLNLNTETTTGTMAELHSDSWSIDPAADGGMNINVAPSYLPPDWPSGSGVSGMLASGVTPSAGTNGGKYKLPGVIPAGTTGFRIQYLECQAHTTSNKGRGRVALDPRAYDDYSTDVSVAGGYYAMARYDKNTFLQASYSAGHALTTYNNFSLDDDTTNWGWGGWDSRFWTVVRWEWNFVAGTITKYQDAVNATYNGYTTNDETMASEGTTQGGLAQDIQSIHFWGRDVGYNWWLNYLWIGALTDDWPSIGVQT